MADYCLISSTRLEPSFAWLIPYTKARDNVSYCGHARYGVSVSRAKSGASLAYNGLIVTPQNRTTKDSHVPCGRYGLVFVASEPAVDDPLVFTTYKWSLSSCPRMPRSYTHSSALPTVSMSLTLEPFIEPGSSAVLQRSSLWNPYEVKDEALPLLAKGLESELSPLPPTGRDDPRTLRASLRTHRSQTGTLNLTNAHHFTSQRRISFEGALKLEVDTPDPSWAMAWIDLGATLGSSVGERDQYDYGAPLGARSHEHVADTATRGQRTGSASRRIVRMYLKELDAREHAYLTASPSLLTDFPRGGATGWSVR